MRKYTVPVIYQLQAELRYPATHLPVFVMYSNRLRLHHIYGISDAVIIVTCSRKRILRYA